MNLILYLLLIAIVGGILAILLAIDLVIFIVGFVGCLVTVVSPFSKWRKDSMVKGQRLLSGYKEPPFVRPERVLMSRQRISLPEGKGVLQNASLKT